MVRPYREQRPFVEDTERTYYNFTSGIGAGKTLSGIMRAVANTEQWNPGELGMILAPTGSALRNVILPEMRSVGLLDRYVYKSKHTEEPGLHAPNGARIILETADNQRKIERLRGPSLAWFWMDEAATIPREAWDIMVGRLRAGNYRNAFVTTTPRGYNWVWDRFVDRPNTTRREYGKSTIVEGGDVFSVLGVPTFANPHTPEDYKERAEREYKGAFYEQEVLGQFTKFEGLVYPWFDPAEQVVTHKSPFEHPGATYYGLDWGHNNPAVLLCVQETREGETYVLDEVYQSRLTITDLVDLAIGMQERYGRGTIYCDPAEPASIEEFTRAGLDALAANNGITPGIQFVSSLHESLYVSEQCPNLINEFSMYRYPDGGDGETPVKVNDHAMDALRYALFTHHERGGLSLNVVSGNMY